MRSVDDQIWTVNGTPTDSVLLAVHHIIKDKKPDLFYPELIGGPILGKTSHIPERSRGYGRDLAGILHRFVAGL